MTWPVATARRRPAFVRHALALGLVAFAACVGLRTGCNERLPGLAMIPAMAVQLLSAVVSFGWAVVALARRDQARAFSEFRVAILMVLAMVVAEAVFESMPPPDCE